MYFSKVFVLLFHNLYFYYYNHCNYYYILYNTTTSIKFQNKMMSIPNLYFYFVSLRMDNIKRLRRSAMIIDCKCLVEIRGYTIH